MSEQIKVFIGYDPRESVAFYTLAHSIWCRASRPVTIVPLRREQLLDVHDRPRERFQSNDFTFTRWLVPHLCGYEGWAIFMDCDMLVRRDIAELWALRDSCYAVQVVKHDYAPQETAKYLGNEQDAYARKNWSSVMLMNCAACTELTPRYVNTAPRLDLHQFKWLEGGDETMIGALPTEWNHLVGYGPTREDAALVHFTIGGPYFNGYQHCEFAPEWARELDSMMRCDQQAEDAA
jgi:hypothetical protein